MRRSGNRTLLVCGKCGLDKCNGTGNVRFADIDRQMSVFFIEGGYALCRDPEVSDRVLKQRLVFSGHQAALQVSGN